MPLVLGFAVTATPAGGQVGAPSAGFPLAFGSVDPTHEPFRQWVAGSPALGQHLRWLGDQLDLPAPVPVVFLSCGVANAFYRPDRREIQICFEWIIERRDQVQSRTPGAEKLTDAVVRSVAHVINHEVGHALVRQLNLPVLGREEDAADGFSAFLLGERGDPLDRYSILQGALANQRGFLAFEDQADVHSLGQQRFFNLLCWLYGSDPTRFAGFATQGGLPARRQQTCPFEWTQLVQSWTTVLGPRLRPKPAVVLASGPQQIAIASSQRVALPAGAAWTARFQLPAGDCRLSLTVTTLEGGQLDLVTMVLDDYNYLTWESKQSGVYWEPAFRSGRERRVVADVPLKGPGRFALVVTNDFSLLTAKVAEVTGQATCS